MPHVAPLHLSAEPSLVTDRETPSHDVGVTEFNPWNLPLDSLVNHNGLTVEPTDSHRPVSIATQVCATFNIFVIEIISSRVCKCSPTISPH
jgi:hypothetical protein